MSDDMPGSLREAHDEIKTLRARVDALDACCTALETTAEARLLEITTARDLKVVNALQAEVKRLRALMESEGICETCGNDRAAWDRLLTRARLLESLLAEALPWWTEEGDIDAECADLVHRIADALGFGK